MYTIIEMQTSAAGGTAVLPAVTKSDFNEALSVYFSKLAVAATSPVEVHAVVMLNEKGHALRNESFVHETVS